MARRTYRGLAVTALQWTVALAALAWLLTGVDLAEVARLLGGVGPGTLLALAAVTAVGLMARFETWRAVLAPVRPVGVRTSGGLDLVVNFVNQLLPSRLSGRLAAPFVIRSRTGMAYADATAVSGVHTGIYAVLYGATAAAGLALAVGRLSPGLLAVLALSTGLYLAAGAVVLAGGANLPLLDWVLGAVAGGLRRVPRVGPVLAERLPDVGSFTSDSAATFRELSADPGVWLRYAAGWVVALVVAPGLRVWLLRGSFGAGFEPAVFLPLYLVTAYSVTLLPVSPGGIGVTEATATAVFVALGVPGSVIVPVIFVDRVLGVYLPALAGWYPSLGLDLSALGTDGE